MSTRFKKLCFSALMTLGVVGLLELGARGYEAMSPAPPPTPLPAPGPLKCLPDCLPGVAAMPEQPQDLPRGIPMQQHPTRGWMLPPGVEMVETGVATRVNSLGLRGGEISSEKAPQEVRILTLGDSSVFGYGVEEHQTFGQVAATVLGTFWRVPVHSFNGGVPGYTSVQALATLNEVGPVVRPDWVVIAAIWSDLFQTDTPLRRPGRKTVPFALYRLGIRLLGSWLPAQKVGWLDVERGVGTPAENREARTGLEKYRRTLDEIVAQTRAHGARPVFLILPAPIDLDPGPPPATIVAYRQAMVDAAAAAEAPMIDGAGLFRQDGASNQEFYDQIHPSRTGHARLGAAIAATLSQMRNTSP